MPWEVTIRRADHTPLGNMNTVRRQIMASLPGMTFYREPSGPEKIAAARATGVEFPEVLRKHFEQQPAVERAEFKDDSFSILLYGFESQPLLRVHAEVRGNGNPLPALSALCIPNGWVAIDDAERKEIDLCGEQSQGWEAFRAYRDSTVRKLDRNAAEERLIKAIFGDSINRKSSES